MVCQQMEWQIQQTVLRWCKRRANLPPGTALPPVAGRMDAAPLDGIPPHTEWFLIFFFEGWRVSNKSSAPDDPQRALRW